MRSRSRLPRTTPPSPGFPALMLSKPLKRIVVGLATTHKANSSNAADAWGQQWQSSMWTYYVGLAGWLLYDNLTPAERQEVARMVADEAAYTQAIKYERGLGFMYTAAGKLLYTRQQPSRRGCLEQHGPHAGFDDAAQLQRGSEVAEDGDGLCVGFLHSASAILRRKVLMDGGRIGSDRRVATTSTPTAR
ncbi:MAG: hypothetical protein V9E81_14315 [Marmoricola sp.]